MHSKIIKKISESLISRFHFIVTTLVYFFINNTLKRL